MATQADVRRIALSLLGVEEEPDHFAFGIRKKGKLKGFAWVWMERVDPKKPRVPQPRVIAVRVASLDDKEFLLGLDPEKFFTEPHYNGFPAVLVRPPAVTTRELRPLITQAWRCQAPRSRRPSSPLSILPTLLRLRGRDREAGLWYLKLKREPAGDSMRFLSMVKSAENQGPAPQALQDAMSKLIADSLANGSLIQTGGLGASATGFRIRSAGGMLTVTDGPFPETKEVIGGYAVLEWPTRQAAVESALAFMRLHTEHWPLWEGECKVRPIERLAP